MMSTTMAKPMAMSTGLMPTTMATSPMTSVNLRSSLGVTAAAVRTARNQRPIRQPVRPCGAAGGPGG